MSTYNELIKNFENIRDYMRQFYIYGFKSRGEYCKKSSRSYDDERRRIESWLGYHTDASRTSKGKNIFISIDTRTSKHNPLYKAWKTKSFTNGDITFHFILFDILDSPKVKVTIKEILQAIDETYLRDFKNPILFDESTIRKKLKEYCEIGIIMTEKIGGRVYYSRTKDVEIAGLHTEVGLDNILDFYSEVAPCGVIGSFLLDKYSYGNGRFTFKNHYITSAVDSDILAELFVAMQNKCVITLSNLSRRKDEPRDNRVVPLRIFISVQNGRQYLLAYSPDFNCIKSYRIDYLSRIKIDKPTPRFDELRLQLDEMQKKMWGVSTKRYHFGKELLEHVSFTIVVEENEAHIINRLYNEKRVGRVEQIDANTYRFTADVYDSMEMVPWIRTYLGYITKLNFSNRTVENQFKGDIYKMYQLYGLKEEELK